MKIYNLTWDSDVCGDFWCARVLSGGVTGSYYELYCDNLETEEWYRETREEQEDWIEQNCEIVGPFEMKPWYTVQYFADTVRQYP